VLLKPNSITLAGSELVRSRFEAGSRLVRSRSPTSFEPASVMEFGLPHAVNGSEVRKVLCLAPSICVFLFVYEISREPLNGFAPNSHGKRVGSLARTSLKFKVKGQRFRSRGTKTAFFGPFSGLCAVYVW